MIHFKPGELEKRVDEVLFYIWDPIGVSPNPDARTEYSSYTKKVLELLNNDADAYKISNYLSEIEAGMMSLKKNSEKSNRVAELLIAHKEAIENGLG